MDGAEDWVRGGGWCGVGGWVGGSGEGPGRLLLLRRVLQGLSSVYTGSITLAWKAMPGENIFW